MAEPQPKVSVIEAMWRVAVGRVYRWRERRNPALFVARLHRNGVIDDEMLRRARLGRERAEQEHQVGQADHDRSGRHVWLDVTHYGDSGQRLRCRFCEATEVVPFGEHPPLG